MNEATAEKVANAVIGTAVVGAAYFIVRTPQLRQFAWRLLVTAVTVSAPTWFRREIRESWEESGRQAI